MNDLIDIAKLGGITDLARGLHWPGAEFRRQIARRVPLVREAGVAPGRVALIAHGGTPEFFADLFAVWCVGGAAACLNPALTRNELQKVVAFVAPALILVSDATRDKAEGLNAPLADGSGVEASEARVPESEKRAPSDGVLILFTSGTTGDPKGVLHSRASLGARLRENRARLSGEILARALCPLPTHFGHGLIGNCLTPLAAGGHLFLFQNPGVKGASALGTIIDDSAITFLSSVPSFWKLVLKTAKPPAKGTLRRVNVGSAPLSAGLWDSIIAWAGTREVWNMYGLTETANWVAGAGAANASPDTGLVGTMWGGEAAVLAENGEQAAKGEGEIVLKTPSLMRGYFRRDDLTSAVMAEGWYRTGDIGRIDGAGNIRLLGRTSTFINKAGIKILPEEVDALLEGHPEVAEACAFAVPDAVSGETVGAAVVLKGAGAADAGTLRAWCQERIRPDGVPERWFFLPDIPKTDRGKVNRARVRAACLGEE